MESSFAGMTGAAAGAIGVPQDSQNLPFGASAAPQFRQTGTASIFAPQDSQNFIPGATGRPHFEQGLGFSIMDIHHMIRVIMTNWYYQ
jgi:hypothetical protein